MRPLKNRLEFIALCLLFIAFRSLPLDMASGIGGFMARSVGPFLRAHKTAIANLSAIYPNMDKEKKRKLLMSMWDNLGRVAAELPHLPGKTLFERITIHGLENLPKQGEQVLFFSGHIGNWELLSPTAFRNGTVLSGIYRKANNPLVDAMITRIRATQATDLFPKGPSGAVKFVRSIKAGHSIAMLIDQKMNDGISVPFFKKPAMTAPAIAEFALRYNMPIVPARVIRTQGSHFAATIYPPLVFEKTGDQQKDVLAIMTQINQTLESWISEHPEQWFWVHKRWPKDVIAA
jgi:KDO2-lipid IV(A) lauroyltransferase